ncbi:14734_t:CDS:2, partial [Entrophospora sp. SA101]
NGHICLNVLYNQWSPVLSVRSVCLSIQSMLSSCTTKEPPPDNSTYVKNAKESPKQTQWYFHGEKNNKLPFIYNQKIRNEVLKLQKTDGQYNFNRLAFIGDNILGFN